MGVFKKLTNIIRKQENNLDKIKHIYAEYSSIAKKSGLYNTVQWSADEQKKFDKYWKQNYGKTIPNKWHRLYQCINGAYNEKYFPEYLYSISLEPKINPRNYAEVFSDKNLLKTLFYGIDGLVIPKSYIYAVNGSLFDENSNAISESRAEEILGVISDCVIKPTVDSGSGHGVVVVSGGEQKPGIAKMQAQYNGNFVVQQKIRCCKELEQLSPNSVSTFRVMTFLTEDGIHSAPLALRIGTGKSKIDNIHAGGIGIAVSDDGKLNEKAYLLGYGNNNEAFTSHPDTGIRFSDCTIPSVETMLCVAKKMHARVPQLGLISWDFTINDKNEVVVIEANTREQSVWFPQMISGKALFGEYTDFFVKEVKNEFREDKGHS